MATNDLTFVTPCCGLCEPHTSVPPVFLNVSIPFKMHATVITSTFHLFTINVSISFPYSCVLKLVMSCNSTNYKGSKHTVINMPLSFAPSLTQTFNLFPKCDRPSFLPMQHNSQPFEAEQLLKTSQTVCLSLEEFCSLLSNKMQRLAMLQDPWRSGFLCGARMYPSTS